MKGGSVTRAGRVWRYRFDGPHGPNGERNQISKSGFRTQGEAWDAMRDRMQQIKADIKAEETRREAAEAGGRTEDESSQFGHWVLQDWFPEHERSIRRSTADAYKTIIINHIASDAIGQINLADITKRDMQGLFSRLERKPGKAAGTTLKKKTLRNIYVVLSVAFDSAAKDGLIQQNPISTMKKPRLESPSEDIWDEEQVHQFLDLVEIESPRMKPLYLLAAFTGMRRGEYAGLRWANVSFNAGTLSVVETRLYSGGDVYVAEPKAKASVRTIALASDVVAALAQAKAVQEADAVEHGDEWIDSGYVFTKPTGEPLHPDYITKRFRRDVTKAGIPNGIPLMKLHGLRHLFATTALGLSLNPKDVSTYIGHGDVNTTLTIYSQDRVGAHAEVARKVQNQFRAPEIGAHVTIPVTSPSALLSTRRANTTKSPATARDSALSGATL